MKIDNAVKLADQLSSDVVWTVMGLNVELTLAWWPCTNLTRLSATHINIGYQRPCTGRVHVYPDFAVDSEPNKHPLMVDLLGTTMDTLISNLDKHHLWHEHPCVKRSDSTKGVPIVIVCSIDAIEEEQPFCLNVNMSLNTMINPLMLQLQRIFTTYHLLKNQCSTEFGIRKSQACSYFLYQRSDGTISGAAQVDAYRCWRSSLPAISRYMLCPRGCLPNISTL